MLKKLRLKFILINMLIITVMLGVVFALLLSSTSRNLERESMEMMERIARNPTRASRPLEMPEGVPEVRLPYFSIRRDDSGQIEEIGGDLFDLSDEGLRDDLLSAVDASREPTGVLKAYHLRFTRFDTPAGEILVFADISSEQSTLRNLIKTVVLIGSAAYLVLAGICILLSRWAVKPVDRAWQQQKQFAADASHELKTPLTVIMTNAELLNSRSLSEPDRQRFTDNILTMSRQMRGLVESLLELARMDAGTHVSPPQTLNLSDAVSAAAMVFEPVFFEKELPFTYEVAPDITMLGNEGQLRQLVEILLDNAAKYVSPGGETRLTLRRTGHRRCLLEAANQGEPIPAAELKELFKRFYRADKVRTMNHSYGLGLSIAKNITEAHRGRIWAESRGGFNRFFVELPTR